MRGPSGLLLFSGGKLASLGPLRFLLKPDSCSPRCSESDEVGAKARGRGLEGDRAALEGVRARERRAGKGARGAGAALGLEKH